MSAKDQFTEQLIWEHHASTTELVKQENIKKEAIQGIRDDLLELYNHCKQLQEQYENEN